MNQEIIDNSIPSVWDAEDKIFSLCMIEIDEFPQYLTKFDDIVEKGSEKLLAENFKGMNLDSVRQRVNGDLINIEHHSSINEVLLRRDYGYATTLHNISGEKVYPFIFNTGNMASIPVDYMNESMFYNPTWINTCQVDAVKKLNNVKYKLLNNEVVDVFEVLDLIWMPKFKLNRPIDDMILELVDIHNDLITEKYLLPINRKSLILWTSKYVNDVEKLDEIKRGLKMSKLEFGNMLDNIRSARISGELMRAEERGEERGIEIGMVRGEERGIEIGMVRGEELGIEQGSVRTRDEIYSKVIPILLNNHTPDEISAMFDVSLEYVLRYSYSK